MNSYQQQQQIQPNMQMGSGLTRYRSAPSSYFDTILSNTTSDGSFGADDFARLFNPRASSPETQRIFTRFMNSAGATQEDFSQDLTPQPQSQPRLNSQFPTPRQHQLRRQHSKGYSSVSTMMYRSDHNFEAVNSAVESSFERLPGSIDSEQIKMEGGGNNSALTRHGTSPAGLFASVGMETGLPINPWDDSAILSDDFLKGLAEEGNKTFGTSHASDDQNQEAENQPPTLLSRHLSLPKGSADLSATDKLLPDSVTCHVRARRGCATHPRSIAERVRRNRISERTRKLQELVPSMEKQTNTADMLDLAFDYIKDLQRQVKTLSDNRAKCSCSARMKS